MTGDFVPPGRQPSEDGSSSKPDAPAPFSAPGRGPVVGPVAPPPNMLRSGRRLAVAAWIAIVAGVLLLVGIVWSATLALADDTLNFATVGDTGTMHAAQLVPGMCLTEVGADGEVQEVEVVPCDEPHRAEVFTQKSFDLAKHPGEQEVRDQALQYCGERIVGDLPETASWVAWIPSAQSWSRGDRTALCIAVFDEPLSEPLSPHGIRGLDTPGDGQGI